MTHRQQRGHRPVQSIQTGVLANQWRGTPLTHASSTAPGNRVAGLLSERDAAPYIRRGGADSGALTHAGVVRSAAAVAAEAVMDPETRAYFSRPTVSPSRANRCSIPRVSFRIPGHESELLRYASNCYLVAMQGRLTTVELSNLV